jgi:hypothetical protein
VTAHPLKAMVYMDQAEKRNPVRTRSRRGQSVIEFTLMAPWILLLFMGIFDLGFYCYALVMTENAARVAALRVQEEGGVDAVTRQTVCDFVISEMRMMTNVGFIGDADGTNDATCLTPPLQVGVEDIPISDARSADRIEPGVLVTVTYDTIQLFPIPGIAGQLSMTRTVLVRRGGG